MSVEPSRSEEIKELVREKYGSRARGVIELRQAPAASTDDSGCCGPADLDRAMRIYQESQLEELPVDSVAASAGAATPLPWPGCSRGKGCWTWDREEESTASWPPARWGNRAGSSAWT